MPKDMSESIVYAIVKDLTDRRGLRQEWEQIDSDIQDEIKKEWREIVNREVKKAQKKEDAKIRGEHGVPE